MNPEATIDWLSELLESQFFDPCESHRELRKNEKNAFCIDCSVGFCRHCTNSHRLHRWLQICKYVYHKVVRLQDVQKHLDCSRIQTYKINGEKAVHLNPRPQSKDTKPSTKLKTGGTCEVCGKFVQEQPNRFCSIACKVSVVSVELNQQQKVESPAAEFADPEITTDVESSLSSTDLSEENQTGSSLITQPRKRLGKRKGVPGRAPFF